jgi:hypothetical protein
MKAVFHPSVFPQSVEEQEAAEVLAEVGVPCSGFLREIPDQHLILFDDAHSSTLALVVPTVVEGGADLVRSHLEKANARLVPMIWFASAAFVHGNRARVKAAWNFDVLEVAQTGKIVIVGYESRLWDRKRRWL